MAEEPPALKRKGRASAARLRDYGGGGGGGDGGRNLLVEDWRRNLMVRNENICLIDNAGMKSRWSSQVWMRRD